LAREHSGIWTSIAVIAKDNPEASAQVRRMILNTADFLAQHQELGRRIRNASVRHNDIRWFVVPKFRNYLIFYRPFREQFWSFACCTPRKIGRAFLASRKLDKKNPL
jgi:plasmid stabilization system protein ParE